MEDEEAAVKPGWATPAGAPIRIYEWLVPPLVPIGLAVIEIFAATSARSHGEPAFSIVAVPLLVAAALALWTFGYWAYRDLTSRAVERYAAMGVVSLFVTGALLSFGTLGIGWLPLVWSGRLLAARRGLAPVRLVRAGTPRRLWLRTAVIAAIVAASCLLLLPLANGLGLVPLIVLVMLGRIVAPFVFGFAFRLRPGASGIF